MAECKACGGWFSSTAPDEICHTCERALKRLNGYALPVMRCKDCKHRAIGDNVCIHPNRIGDGYIEVKDDDFCSYGERREGE